MNAIVHARLDTATSKLLKELKRRYGWSESQIVRRGIRALSALEPRLRRKRVHGIGRFRSGVRDLGSNKAHLRDFGK
jgi:hypothetical protein